MRIDELRSGLTTLSDEMEPFEGDVRVLHRRERRRRVVVSSLVAALLVVVGVSTVAIVRNHRQNRIQVTGASSKEVPAAQLSHVDVIVVPASPDVHKALDATPLVAHYTRVLRAYRGGRNSIVNIPTDVRCALETSDGYAVRASVPGPGFAELLRQSLGKRATVFDVSNMLGFDLEIFLKTGASSNTAAAIEARLKADQSVKSYVYVSTTDAYEIFKRDFADQPALVKSTKPSELPVSFRIDVTPGASVAATLGRYQHLAGVDLVLTEGSSGPPLLFARGSSPLPPTGTSACAKP
jgi:hypothetical protein